MKQFFITGTDTDCGKTYVLCQLLRFLHSNQWRAQALKPIASGGVLQAGKVINSDIRLLQQHNFNPQQIIHYRSYLPAIAPHLAAKQVNETITATQVKEFCQQTGYQQFDHLLIEGAGGLMVPLNTQETWIDFLQMMNLSVILVVGIRLGCINHALLTDAVLIQQQIPYAGWIANCLTQDSLDEEIISTLKIKMQRPLITTLSYCGKIEKIDKKIFSG